MTSGAWRILGLPSSGYQSRSPATKTLGSCRKSVSRPSLIRTIHLNWSVFSDMGRPSSSGYWTVDCGGCVNVVLMTLGASGLDCRMTTVSVCHVACSQTRAFSTVSRETLTFPRRSCQLQDQGVDARPGQERRRLSGRPCLVAIAVVG